MSRNKVTILIYYIALLIGIIVLSKVCMSMNELLQTNPLSENIDITYNALQKKAALFGIISFVILLVVGLVLFYLTTKPTYVVLSNIAYISLILFVFITINRTYFTVQNMNYAEKSEYWITVFMGIFYIIGAVLVSAIAYITVRNYTKRSKHTLNKSSR